MGIPTKLIEFLNQNKASHTVLHHPEAFTAQELAAIEGVKGRNHAKVVMVKADNQMLMTVLPADHRVELEQLDRLTGKRTALATEAEFKALFPDCAVGTMPPFGKLYGLPTWVDKSLTNDAYIVFEAGTHTDAIRISYKDFERLTTPQVAEFAVKLH